MNLDELLAKLGEAYAGKPDEVFAAFQSKVHGLYQKAFDRGHGEGLKKGRDEKTTVAQELTDAKAKLDTTEKELNDLKAKVPDIAATETKYQRELAEQKEKFEKQIVDLKEKGKTIELNRTLTDLRSRLEKKLNPLYAKVLTQDEDIKKRIHPKDDGSVEILQAGKDIPFSPGDGQQAIDLLVDDLVSKAPAEYRLEKGDNGSEINSGGGGSQGSTVFDRVRKNQKDATEKKTEIKPLEEKLGMAGRA